MQSGRMRPPPNPAPGSCELRIQSIERAILRLVPQVAHHCAPEILIGVGCGVILPSDPDLGLGSQPSPTGDSR
jgi:hypothetical protein